MVDGSFGPIHNTVETSKHSSNQVEPIETEERYHDFYRLRPRKHVKYDRKTSSARSAYMQCYDHFSLLVFFTDSLFYSCAAVETLLNYSWGTASWTRGRRP